MKKFVIFVLFFLSLFLPGNALAAENKSLYCPLCEHRSDDDPLYEKERQFYQKISIIKTVFGKSIDEVALAAAVLHRYNNKELAYEREYDGDFDSNSWLEMWKDISNSKTAKVTDDNGDVVFSEEEAKRIEANEKLDLITTAAIVMIDSNHFGTYSDVCFKDGLAGNGLVGNNSDSGPFVQFFNGLFCGAYEIANLPTPLDYIAGLFSGDSLLVTAASSEKKLVNVAMVCENGYVGGLYGAYKIKDEKRKESVKKLYAQQIIDFANYYKKMYGNDDEDNASCVSNSAGTSGTYSSWKQYDSKWKDIQIGPSRDDNVGSIGCLVTSMAIQISRSGTNLGSLPNGQEEFNPGSFALSLKDNNGFDSNGNLIYAGASKIAPNFQFAEFKEVNISDNKTLADTISKELSSGYDDKYQKFIILFIKHRSSNSHWIAVDSVSGDTVNLFDPAGSGNTLDDNYQNWVVKGYNVMYATDVMQGQAGSSNSCGGCDLNRFIGFLAYNEGHDTCNFQGRGEGTGYGAGTLAGDAGGQTSAFGITISDEEVANKIGYTSFSSELYSGCTEKKNTEKLLVATIDYLTNDWTQKQIDQIGITVSENEKYALASVNYGGITLAVPIMQAIKTYGKDSEEVFEAFKHSIGIDYALRNGFHGLMRRRLTEYEIFMTGNYEAESSNYLSMPYIQNGLAMSKSDVMSHFPSKRSELLEGMDFAPIDGSCATDGGGSGELVCEDGKAVSSSTGSSGETGSVVDCAKAQIGKPYVWAAEGPDSFDCSGLVKYCYKQALGVDVPHYTGDLLVDKRFKDVSSYDELSPGDIILPHSEHVVIYIGDGKVIHAPKPGDVVTELPIYFSGGSFRHYVG